MPRTPFVAGASAAAPCAQCGHKCAAPEGEAFAEPDEGTIAAMVAEYIKATHLPSLQERFARVLRGFEVRRREVKL